MKEDILHNWQKKSTDHQKQYKQFLSRADKNKVLKQLPDLHEEVDDGLQKVSELHEKFSEYRNKYASDNQAALTEPASK